MTRRGSPWLVSLARFAALLLALAAPAGSAEEETLDLEKLERERAARASLHPVRRRVSRYLEAAQKTVDQGRPQEGRALLDKLDPKRLNPYERALVYRLQAYLAYAAFDYAGTIQSFEKVLAEEALTVRDDNRVRFAISQIRASLGQWRETIDALGRWFRYVEEPEPLAYYLLGVAHYQLDEFDESLVAARKAVDLTPAPAEGWLQLLSALYTQREDYRSALPVVQDLVLRFPKKRYWVQLALLRAAVGDYPTALAVQQLAYRQGLLTEDKELQRLARSLLHQDIPYAAAGVLEKGLADGALEPDAAAFELLANASIAAREYERSLAPLEKAAALSPQGNLYVRLAQVQMQREAWQEATEQLQKGIEKRGLSDPGNAELLLGIAYYNAARADRARAAFARAREHASTRDAAQRWIAHLDEESGVRPATGSPRDSSGELREDADR